MIKCKECGCTLTDEIKFDLGWHCMYPCDHVSYFHDDSIVKQVIEMTSCLREKHLDDNLETKICKNDIDELMKIYGVDFYCEKDVKNYENNKIRQLLKLLN